MEAESGKDVELSNVEAAAGCPRPTAATAYRGGQSKLERTIFGFIFDSPFLLTYVGTWHILIGTVSLLVGYLFLKEHIEQQSWLSAASLCVITLGSMLYALTSHLNQQLLICYGAHLLFIGLSVFTAAALWSARDITINAHTDDPEEYEDNTETRAKMIVAAACIIVLSTVLFVIKGYQRFMKPMFGPTNYNAFGAAVFGAGACCHLILEIKNTSDKLREDDDMYDPHPHTGLFGSYLLVLGAILLLLAVSRSHYAADLLVISNYPSVTSFKMHTTMGAFLLVLLSGLGFFGAVSLVIGRVFVSGADRVKVQSAALALVSAAIGGVWATCSSTISQSRKPALIRSHNILSKGTSMEFLCISLYCVSMGLRLALVDQGENNGGTGRESDRERGSYPDDLSCAATALGIIASVILLANAAQYSNMREELLGAGNFDVLSRLSFLGGCICVFLFSLRRSISNDVGGSEHSGVAFDGTELLGYMLWSVSWLFRFLHCNIALDYHQIKQGEDLSLRGILKKIGFYRDFDGVKQNLSAKEKMLREHSLRTHSRRFVAAYGAGAGEVNSGVEDEIELLDVSQEFILTTDVVVIGCGPVGLTLCNEVGKRDVKVIGVEMRRDVIPDSRFFVLSTASMEGLKRTGVTDLIFERAVPQTFGTGAVFVTGLTQDDGELIEAAYGEPRAELASQGASLTDKHRTTSQSCQWAEQQSQRCMQSIQEQSNKDVAEANPNIRLMYGYEAVAMDSDENGVVIKIKKVKDADDETPDVFYYVKSKYLVGCDGPGSFVSKTLQVKFDGFVNLGVTRTILFKAPGLIDIVRKKYGEVLQYQVARPGLGAGFCVMNDLDKELWTFNLVGLTDGRNPRELPKDAMYDILQDFIGPGVKVSIVGDNGWFWNLFFARSLVYGRVLLAGDAAHSWPPFGGLGGNTGYGDAFNLGWKLAAAVKGWGSSGGLLGSYNYERREAGLRTLLYVLHVTINRDMVLRAARLVSHRWLWWSIRWRWILGNRGTHAGNHFLANGINLGIRYHSNLMHFDDRHQDTPTVENSPNSYKPFIGPGCRIPHLKFPSGESINDTIAFDGYTLLVVDAAVIVTDSTAASSYARGVRPGLMPASTDKPLVKEIMMYFSERNIPLKVIDILPEVESVKMGPQSEVAALYLSQSVILVRPDLYILWNLVASVERVSTFDLKQVAESACCEVNKDDIIAEWKSTADFLTRRFITNIQGYRSLHSQAIYFEDADKNAVMKAISKKANAEVTTLTTKIVNSAENKGSERQPEGYSAMQPSRLSDADEPIADSAAITLRMVPSDEPVMAMDATAEAATDLDCPQNVPADRHMSQSPGSPSGRPASRVEAAALTTRMAFTQPPLYDNRRRMSALARGGAGSSSAGVEDGAAAVESNTTSSSIGPVVTATVTEAEPGQDEEEE